jgi:hypothetical protein
MITVIDGDTMITRYKKRSILDGYFNPLVFWYQWDYLRSPAFFFHVLVGYLRLALKPDCMIN